MVVPSHPPSASSRNGSDPASLAGSSPPTSSSSNGHASHPLPPCRFFNAREGCTRRSCPYPHTTRPVQRVTPSPPSHASPQTAPTVIPTSSQSPASTRIPPADLEPSSSSTTRSRSMTVCKWFRAGHCRRAESCWFSHDLESRTGASEGASHERVVQLDDSHPTGPQSQHRPGSKSLSAKALSFTPSSLWVASSSSNAHIYGMNNAQASTSAAPAVAVKDYNRTVEEEEEEVTCGICIDTPHVFGLLENCDHVFCLDCLKAWRWAKEKDVALIESGVTKQCPTCRAQSHFITPSHMARKGEAKARAIERYKDKLSRVPCKHFEKSKRLRDRPFCPFGDDCHYSHKLTPQDDRYLFHAGADEMFTSPRRARRRPLGTGLIGLARLSATASVFDGLGGGAEVTDPTDLASMRGALRSLIDAFGGQRPESWDDFEDHGGEADLDELDDDGRGWDLGDDPDYAYEAGAWINEIFPDASEGFRHAMMQSHLEVMGRSHIDVEDDDFEDDEDEVDHEDENLYWDDEEINYHDFENRDGGGGDDDEYGDDVFGLRRAFAEGYARADEEGSEVGFTHNHGDQSDVPEDWDSEEQDDEALGPTSASSRASWRTNNLMTSDWRARSASEILLPGHPPTHRSEAQSSIRDRRETIPWTAGNGRAWRSGAPSPASSLERHRRVPQSNSSDDDLTDTERGDGSGGLTHLMQAMDHVFSGSIYGDVPSSSDGDEGD